MMSDYMAYSEGPEEDETRQPRPDEPEEYWRAIAEENIKNSQLILLYATERQHERYYKQLMVNIILFMSTMDNFIKILEVK